MTNYRSLVGQKIKKVSSNPSDALEGQVWYNTTEKKLKGLPQLQAWASTGPLNTARGFVGSTGTQAAALCIGGLTSAPTILSDVEEYNGSGWGAGGSLPAGTYGLGAAGTQTAALIFGGSTSSAKVANSYTYNGSSWTATPNSMNTARDQLVGGGTQTSALAVGGRESSAMVTNMEEWNGTSWSNLTAMSQARGYAMANGPETAFFIAGGATGNNAGTPMTNLTEEYDGSSLSSGANVNTARSAGGAAGDSSAGLIWGGWTGASPGLVLNCEKYDGTSWSEIVDLATVKRGAGSGSGTSNTAAIAAGNYGPPATTTSEEFTQSSNVITGAVFASGGTANTSRRQLGYTTNSPQNDFMGYGGFSPSGFINNSETYDGTSWSEGNNLNESKGQLAGAGESSSAALAFGGNGSNANTEEYNGTSWSEQNNMNTGRYELGGAGTQTAGLAVAGESASSGTTTLTEHYNGTSWTTSGTMNTARRENDAAGTQTAAIVAGGGTPSAIANTETYNGSSWTSVNSKITASVAPRTMGGPTSQTAAITNGGQAGSGGFTSTEQWNGTNFVTGPNMNQQRFSHTAGGSIAAGIVAFGDAPTPAMLKTSEEFTGETTALNVKTLTTS